MALQGPEDTEGIKAWKVGHSVCEKKIKNRIKNVDQISMKSKKSITNIG